MFSVKFSNSGDGIQSVYVKPVGYGQLRLPATTPREGYQASLSQRSYKAKIGEREHNDNQAHAPIGRRAEWDQNYFFRVRSENKYGAVVSTLYGKIHDDFIWELDRSLEFTYYLNPTPNDRNVEFDPDKNLFGEPSCRVGSDQSMAVGNP